MKEAEVLISHFILIPVFRGVRLTTPESVRRQIHKTSLCTLNFFVCLFLLLKQKYVGKCHYIIDDSEVMAFLSS